MAKRKLINLVEKIPADKQKEIAREVIEDYGTDILSRKSWEEKRNRWYKLWACIVDPKTEPWPGCSNVCLPILAAASNQFHSRSYQSIFAPPGMVKAIPVAENDYKKAKNVETYMNWQTMYEMEEYEEVFDKLLQLLPINGTHFKKLRFDSALDRATTDHVSPLDLVLPYRTKSLETARRMVHRLWLHYDELQRNNERGLYVNFDKVKTEAEARDDSPTKQTSDEAHGEEKPIDSKDAPHLILERHSDYNLDGTMRPYIITVDRDSDTLLRMTSRVFKKKTLNFFIDYHFIPNPDGFYSFGFGHFLEVLIEMANTAFNQIFDSGRLTNQPFGFYGRRSGIKQRTIKLKPGLMTEVEDAKQILFPNMQRVDMVLFQVLGIIQQHIEQFTSTSDYLSGRESRGTKTPTAHGTLAIIEQGLVTFAVMTKRIFRSLRKELRLLMNLNHLYLPDTKEYRIMGAEDKIAFADIKAEDFDGVYDVIPIGDPSYASKLTRRQDAVELYQILMSNPLIVGNPETGEGANQRAMYEITSDLIDAYDKKNKSKILPELPEDPVTPEMENAMFVQGDYKSPVPGENHQQHIMVHMNFIQTDYFKAMPEAYQMLVVKHIKETEAIAYLDSMQNQGLGGQG